MTKTMLQGFDWYLSPEDKLWKKIEGNASHYKELGVSDIWLPPASKGHRGMYDSGYGVYDLYDLGEFDQKGSVATKYGTKDEFIRALKSLQNNEIGVIVDIVLNHRIGADRLETIEVKRVNPENRYEIIDTRKIDAWTQFDFGTRDNKYSDFKWNHNHFTGIDYDASNKETGVFLFKDKEWDTHLSRENQNYDYLMGVDVDFRNEDVMLELKHFLDWYQNVTNFSGVRLDAIKHINALSMGTLIEHLKSKRDIYSVGEYWSSDLEELDNYLTLTKFNTSLFDVPLHHKFFDISYGRIKDIRNIFAGTLTELHPQHSVPFVDNHDTQKGQSLESWIEPWFRDHANAFILLHNTDFPCVFSKDLDSILVQKMMKLRSQHRSGNFIEHEINEKHVVFGFDGNEGYICSVSIDQDSLVSIQMNPELAGTRYSDIMDSSNVAIIDDKGILEIKCYKDSVNVFKADGGNDV